MSTERRHARQGGIRRPTRLRDTGGALFGSLLGVFSNWYDVWDPTSGVSRVGSKVDAWTGLVAGNVLAQAVDDNRPTFNGSGENGRPEISWTALDQVLEDTSLAAGIVAGDRPCFWMVVRVDTLTATDDEIIHYDDGNVGFTGFDYEAGTIAGFRGTYALTDGIQSLSSSVAVDTVAHKVSMRPEFAGNQKLQVDSTTNAGLRNGGIIATPARLRIGSLVSSCVFSLQFFGITTGIPPGSEQLDWDAAVQAEWAVP